MTLAPRASAQTGLVAAYGFNETTGTTASDASGNGHTGTLSGASWNASGRFGGALSFNGTTNMVTVADTALLDLTTGMTLEAWVNPSSLAAWRTVMFKEVTGGLSYVLYASDTGGRPSTYIRRTSDINAASTSALTANTWVHLAATYNGSTLLLYVNGGQVASKAVTGSIVTSAQPLRIGGNSIWGEYFAGRIDEVRIYNRALSATEIQTDMNTPVGGTPAPDFTVAATPASRTVTQGNSTSYTVSTGALNGFAGTVNLSATGLPANATATFTPASITGSGSATLDVTTAANTPAGSPNLTITATSGALNHTATVSLVVNATPSPDFTLSATPGSRTVTQGNGTSYSINIGAVNGFAGAVNLGISGLPANTSWSFTPASVTGSGSATLDLTTAATTPTGTSTLTITGTSGALTHSATVSLVVNPPADFTISATPPSATVSPGGTASYTVSIGAVSGFAGAVTLAATGLPANTTASFTPASVTGSGSATLSVTTAASTPTGSPTLTITGTSGALSHSATVTLAVSTAPPSGVISIDFVGTGVSMGATESAGVVAKTNWNNATGATRATPLALVDETGAATPATVTWTANGVYSTPIVDQAGNRRMMKGYLDTSNTSVTSVTVAGLAAGAYDVYAYGDGYNGSATRTAAYRISGAGITATTINLTDAANANFNTAFTQAINSSGNYVKFSINAGGFTLTATPGASSDSTARASLNGIQIVPTAPPSPDFTIGAAPGSRTITQGNSTSYTVSTGALNGFGGTVNLSVTGLPANATGTFTPASVAGSATATLDVTTAANTPTGSPTLTIMGTSGALSHTTGVSLVVNGTPVPDFSISAAPGSRTVNQGSGTSYTVTIGATNGFAGTVNLGLTGLPANATGTFTPASVTGSGSATLDVTTAANTPAGSPTLTITGTSGALSHTAGVTLVVNPPTYSISGRITPATSGVSSTVSLGGTSTGSTTADSSGNYSFNGRTNGPYVVMPSKNGFSFSPTSANITVNGADVSGVDFTASQAPISVSISAPSNNATVSNAFSITATTTGTVAGVQFRVDGANVGAEDVSAPFSVSLTAPSGQHTLTAVARDAGGNSVTSTTVNVTVSASSGTTLTVNGAQALNTVDGFGVNLNSLSWKNGELRPALDLLVDQLGATTWRVAFDMVDWEATNDNTDPATPNWTYYNALYSNAKFQNLWGTLHYLNQKGMTTNIMLSFMGRVPTWMGGVKINSNMEDEYVEMIATLLYYARNTENVQFDMVDPMTEVDWDGIEGPQVDSVQYTRLLNKLSVRLDSMGLSAIKFSGPNTANNTTGVTVYMQHMMSDSVVMSKTDHFGFHNYEGGTGNADSYIHDSAYPSRNFWITETSRPDDAFAMIGQNAASVMIWDAYDSVYNHAILANRGTTPPNDAGNGPALLAYNSSTGVYTRRAEFYKSQQMFKFVPSGSVRVGVSVSGLSVYAFRHPATGRITLIGRNGGGSSVTVKGQLNGLPPVSVFQLYQTYGSNNFARAGDVVVTSGAFYFTAPADSYFTLTFPGQ